VKTRLGLATSFAAAAALAVPALSSAATVTAAPAKDCYRGGGVVHHDTGAVTGEAVTLSGTGFTPGGTVTITSNGKVLGTDDVDAGGNFSGALTLNLARGQTLKTYAATDQANPALTASVPLRTSALTVNLKPKQGPPGRLFKIAARGFTTGKRLYAHIVKGDFHRTIKIGRLKGPCHKITARKRLFPGNVATGVYRVQFDSRRKYSRKTKVKVLRGFQVTRKFP
jgi:Bacterial Ig domain